MQQRVEHPAEFRADARLGRFGVTQLFTGIGVAIVTVLSTLMMAMLRVGAGKTVLVFLTGTAISAEVLFRYVRSLARWVRFQLRPRWRPADASRAVTPGSDATVQDLVKVQAASGPFLQWMDGYVSFAMRVQAPPSETVTPQQEEDLVLHFQAALKALAEYRIETTLYADLEPDLNREELQRHQQLVEDLPAASGLRRLIEARNAHHRAMALDSEYGRRLVYHVRLSVLPADVPAGQKPTCEAYMAAVVTYLRDAAMAFAAELESAGLIVTPLGAEGVRDVATRQLDPVGWRTAEPPKGTDWTHVGQSMAQIATLVAARKEEAPDLSATPLQEATNRSGPLVGKEVFAVIGAHPEAGCTMVATNLALAFRQRGNAVAAISLDGGANTMAHRIGGQIRSVTAGDWQGNERLSVSGVQGIQVIPGPTRFTRALYDPLAADVVAKVVRQAGRDVDVIVLDLGCTLTAEQQAVLNQATAVLIVATPEDDPRYVEQLQQDVEAAGVAPEAVGVVVNRLTTPSALRLPAALVLPEDLALHRAALAVLVAPESGWARQLTAWVQALGYEEEGVV